MARCAVTVCLAPEAFGGPFVFREGLANACRAAAELGFDAIEVFVRAPEDLDPKQVRSLLEEHRLSLAAVGTGAGWVVHRWCLTDPDGAIRNKARQFIAGIIDQAAGFAAPAIIGSMQGRWGPEVSRTQAEAWLGEALEDLGFRAERRGVPLLLEPLNRYETNLFNRVGDTLKFLERLRTQNVKLLCDLFHMNIEESDLVAALHHAGPRLGHLHFADSNRQAIGFGHTDIKALAQTLVQMDYSGYLSAEIFPLPDSLAAARQTMRSFQAFFGPKRNQQNAHAKAPTHPSENQ